MAVVMAGAMAGVAAGNAAASAAARRAEVARCKLVIENFNNSTANLTEMRDYSSCVSTVYPKPMPSIDLTAAKAFFVVALIGAVIGIFRAKFACPWGPDSLDYLMVAILWSLFLPIGLGALIALCYGVFWLFT